MVLNTKGLVYLHLPYLFINLPDGCIQSDSHMMHKNTQTKTHSFFSVIGQCLGTVIFCLMWSHWLNANWVHSPQKRNSMISIRVHSFD